MPTEGVAEATPIGWVCDDVLRERRPLCEEVPPGNTEAVVNQIGCNHLVATLGQIIGGAVGCEVFLNGKVMAGQECGGSVNVNGTLLKCGDPNGWALKDQSTLILQGNACTAFLNNPFSMLNADFPCGIFSPS